MTTPINLTSVQQFTINPDHYLHSGTSIKDQVEKLATEVKKSCVEWQLPTYKPADFNNLLKKIKAITDLTEDQQIQVNDLFRRIFLRANYVFIDLPLDSSNLAEAVELICLDSPRMPPDSDLLKSVVKNLLQIPKDDCLTFFEAVRPLFDLKTLGCLNPIGTFFEQLRMFEKKEWLEVVQELLPFLEKRSPSCFAFQALAPLSRENRKHIIELMAPYNKVFPHSKESAKNIFAHLPKLLASLPQEDRNIQNTAALVRFIKYGFLETTSQEGLILLLKSPH